MESFYVEAVKVLHDEGILLDIDLPKTNMALNSMFEQLHNEGYSIYSVVPVSAGVGNYRWGSIDGEKSLLKIKKPPAGGFGYGFGYSYTKGFMILAHKTKAVGGSSSAHKTSKKPKKPKQ